RYQQRQNRKGDQPDEEAASRGPRRVPSPTNLPGGAQVVNPASSAAAGVSIHDLTAPRTLDSIAFWNGHQLVRAGVIRGHAQGLSYANSPPNTEISCERAPFSPGPLVSFISLLCGPTRARGSKPLRVASLLHCGGTRTPIRVQTSPHAGWREEALPIARRPCWRTVTRPAHPRGPNCPAPPKPAMTTTTVDTPDAGTDLRSGTGYLSRGSYRSGAPPAESEGRRWGGLPIRSARPTTPREAHPAASRDLGC